MGKKKLINRGGSGQQKVSKKITVEDVNGNKTVLNATVIGVETSKIRKENRASGILDANLNELGFASVVVRPPLSQHELSVLSEFSSELGPNLEAMAMGIEGFGQKVELRAGMTPAIKTTHETEINAERRWLEANLLENPNPDGSLRKLRKQLLKDKESTGNAYLELIPAKKEGMYSCYSRLEPAGMFITKADKKFTRITQRYVNENLQIKSKTFLVRLRKFVQIVGNKKVFFKAFRDPRIIDARTGDELRLRSNGKGLKVPVDSQGKEVPKKFHAREVYHFKIPTTRRTPYGMPRFTGNIIAIKGSRSSEESNILTQQNNNVPSMAVMISGGMLTDGSIERLQEFVDTSIKGDLNYSKFLILEGESTHDGLSGASSMKIEIKPLTNEQHTDALWDTYDEKNSEKIRRAFRQPAVMVGKSDKIKKDEAATAEILAEKYVYNPEREEIDEEWNRIIVQQGIRFHKLKGQTPNVTNEEVLTKILSSTEKTGGTTPRIAHMILTEILNRELPPLVEDDPDFNPDLPFSISVGKLARGMARSNQEGTLSTTGQEEGDKGKDNNEKSMHDVFIEEMERVMDIEAFGVFKKDYFQHEH